jgi:glycosyltransferase involved in cell wall biosynthesis
VQSNGHPVSSASFRLFSENLATQRPAVIIVAPPWPRSGTGRVIQSQIEFYRSRGYLTLFVGVAIHPGYMRTNTAFWNSIQEGIDDFGADRVSIASFDRKRYLLTKCTASVRHGLYATALDWIVDIGRSAQLPEDVASYVRQLPVALIHVNHVFTMGFAQRLRKQFLRGGDRLPIILETHDVQSHLLQERGDINPWTRRRDSLERLIQSEKRELAKANVLVHLSVDDYKFFKAQLPSKPHILAMPTIDEAFVSTVNRACCPPLTEAIDLLFTGYFHSANLAAVTWFFEHVWPLIAQRNYNLKIVGPIDTLVRGNSPKIYEAFRSCFVGQVADLAPYYRAARCAIAPMVSGSGISIKTIEALALGKPFVGTSKAFRGMPMEQVERAGLRAYDAPQAFADAIVHALETRDHSGALSRAAYDSLFSTEVAFASRDEAVRIASDVGRNEQAGLSSAIIPSP